MSLSSQSGLSYIFYKKGVGGRVEVKTRKIILLGLEAAVTTILWQSTWFGSTVRTPLLRAKV